MTEAWPLDPIQAIEHARISFFRTAGVIDGAEAVIEADVAYGSAGIPFIPFNSVTGARFDPASADARIDAVLAWFRERSMPVGWWLGPRDEPADLESRLAARGLVLDDDRVPGMARQLGSIDSLPDEGSADGLVVRPIRDLGAFRDQAEVIVSGFGAPPWLMGQILKFAALGFEAGSPVQNYLARFEGRPVGAALGLIAGDVFGIYNVAVVPEARGRGVGRAVTLAALREGLARGCRIAVLESSEMGYSVYARLGFRDVATYRILAKRDWS